MMRKKMTTKLGPVLAGAALLVFALAGCDNPVNVETDNISIFHNGQPQTGFELWVYPHGGADAPRSVQLGARIIPGTAYYQNATWTSSSDATAAVGNDGYVTAVAAGTATITATTAAGSTATVTVTVRGDEPPTEPGDWSELAGSLIILHAAAVAGGTGNNAHRTFVELQNRSNADISLDGLSLQYALGQGNTWNVIPLSGNIPAGHSFLILGIVGDAAARLQIPDADADLLRPEFQLNNRAFRLALMEGTVPLTVHNPSDMSHDGAVDLRTLIPATGSSDAIVGTQTAAGFIDLLGVINSLTDDRDVMHGAKGAPAYRISNQTSIRRTSLDAPSNNFNDFTGLRWGAPTAAEPLAVADDQMNALRPRNLAYGAVARTFPAMSWAFEPPTLPPPPPPPVGAIAAWNYTVAQTATLSPTWPANSGRTAGSSLEFFFADGTTRANLGRADQDRAAINVANNAAGWWSSVSGNQTQANFVPLEIEDSAGWVITLDTTGYENIMFSAYQSSSNNGPRDFRLAYRIGDSGAWTVFGGEGTVTVQGDGPGNPQLVLGQTFANVPLPATVNNQAAVQVRVWISSTAPRGTGNLTATGGNTSLNHIVFAGTALE